MQVLMVFFLAHEYIIRYIYIKDLFLMIQYEYQNRKEFFHD